MRIVRTFKRCIETIIVMFFMMIAVVNFFSAPSSQGVFGYKGYTVISASMEPTLKIGDYILTAVEPFSQVKNGEIISFLDSGMIVTHRVVSIADDVATTRGDNNKIDDLKVVTAENYVGSFVLRIPYLGYLFIWLQNPLIFAIVMGIIALRLIILVVLKK
ncbi:signal peptidase I [Enterococcus camelliae]|uniref:Signal peptidase I n=1 Tax=Enterococcus camelliae TaxID=453959 RepID=A0ABW5TMK8_9ENTE